MKNGIIINELGTKLYYKDDMLHNEDGPAVIYPNGTVSFYINGRRVDEYKPGFGCFNPKSREEALERLNRKERPYSRELYLADINKRWPEMKNGLIVTEKGTKVYYKDDMVHNEDGPAAIFKSGTIGYYIEGKRHREDGPAVIYPNGITVYYIEGKKHREDGPAIIYPNGTVEYWINGKKHREDGPAVIYSSGTVEYYIEDKLHREDGPAVIYPNGVAVYYINGGRVDIYRPKFGCFNPKSRKDALRRLDSKDRPYARELYLADIDKRWPKKKKLFSRLKFFVGRK